MLSQIMIENFNNQNESEVRLLIRKIIDALIIVWDLIIHIRFIVDEVLMPSRPVRYWSPVSQKLLPPHL